MDEKKAPSYQNTGNQGLLAGRDNPGYGCVLPVPPPAINPPIYSNPVIAQPGFQDNQRLSGNGTHRVTAVQTPPVVYPPDHCALAWFACLCCFWPVGICAIINTNNTCDAISRGDLAGANSYSQSARKYALIAIVVGICVYVISVILRVALASSSSSSSSYSS